MRIREGFDSRYIILVFVCPSHLPIDSMELILKYMNRKNDGIYVGLNEGLWAGPLAGGPSYGIEYCTSSKEILATTAREAR